MEQSLYYLFIVVSLFIIGYVGVLAKNKLKLKDEDLEFFKTILEVVDYISSQFEVKFKDDISTIVRYTIEAIDFVDSYEEISNIEIKKEIVKDKAIEICIDNNIDLGDGVIIEIVDRIVEYLLVIKKGE